MSSEAKEIKGVEMTWGEFFSGIAFIATGVVMVIYARNIVNTVGTSATFERYLGSGGTYTGLRLVGIIFMIVGALLAVGKLDTFFLGLTSAF